MLHTTLNQLRRAGACGQKVGAGTGYDKLRQHLGEGWRKTTPIDLLTILESNGLGDALWCLRAVMPEEWAQRDRLARLLACDYAEHVAHLRKAPRGVTWRPAGAVEHAWQEARLRWYLEGEQSAAAMAEGE